MVCGMVKFTKEGANQEGDGINDERSLSPQMDTTMPPAWRQDTMRLTTMLASRALAVAKSSRTPGWARLLLWRSCTRRAGPSSSRKARSSRRCHRVIHQQEAQSKTRLQQI